MHKVDAHIDYYLVGIGNHSTPCFTEEVRELIASLTVFSGGKRHYDLVKSFLPQKHQWIEIAGKMDQVIHAYQSVNERVLTFASGDPFFYGFGNTLRRFLPKVAVQSFPYFNSIQRLCQKTQTNYNDLQSVSVHGRDWSALDEALINEQPLIGVLTDGIKTPAQLAKRLLQYNFDHYTITVGEELDGEDEQINHYQLQDVLTLRHAALNCVLLKRVKDKERFFGIPDDQFIPLENRPNMITKMPIRLSTLNALQLASKKSFWDIGSCTGSVAIEAKQHFPHLQVHAFEKRTTCGEIIQQNKERFSTPGIAITIADFFELNLAEFTLPDVVFIGGHGNRLKEMIHKIHLINPTARVVTNAVKESTSQVFEKEFYQLGYTIKTTIIQVDHHNKISIHTAVNEKVK